MRRITTVTCVVLVLSLVCAVWWSTPIAASFAVNGPDADGDGVVDLFDLVIVSSAYNPFEPASDPRADINGDGVVDLFDLVLVSSNYGYQSEGVPPPVAPTSSVFPENTYSLHEEQVIGSYAVRVWRDPSASFPFSDVVTIDAYGHPRVQVEKFQSFDPLHGTDITGEGNPDAVIHTFTGGAHCCFRTIAYDLGQAMTKVLETAESNCDVSFLQLDGDPAFEGQTCDDLFAYAYCPYAGSPVVKVILDYAAGPGFVPASPHFSQLYVDDIAQHTLRAEQAIPGEYGEDDGTTKCGLLPVVLDWLYVGDAASAWSELYRLYSYPDVDIFRAEIEQEVGASPLYAPS